MEETDRIERRLKLHDIRVLVSVVQAGSMHKAAERLATSQPAVSRAIGDLEHALGVRLLDRSPRGIEPTQYGRALIRRGVAVFDELRQGVKDIEFLNDPTVGELRIGCTEAMAAGPVFVIVDQLTRRYPRVAFSVMTATGAALYSNLAERKVDLVISRVTEPIPKQMVMESLFDDAMVVAAARRNPLTRQRRIELADLMNERWTLPPPDSFAGAIAINAFRASGLEPPRAAVITLSMNMRNRLLATGRFLTLLAGYSLLFPSKHPTIRALPVQVAQAEGTVAIVTLRNRTLSPLAELFIETARAVTRPLVKSKTMSKSRGILG